MVRMAAESKGTFVVIEGERSLPFRDGSFDLIYSKFVLQHLPRPLLELRIAEFVRLLRSRGLLAFQAPTHISLVHRIQPRRRVYDLFRTIGVSREFLYEKLGLHPSRMTAVAEARVKDILLANGADLIEIDHGPIGEENYASATYYATKK